MKPKTAEKRSYIGANVTPEFKTRIAAYGRRYERRSTADFIRILAEDYMAGRLVRIPAPPRVGEFDADAVAEELKEAVEA